jgi:hypothetical protein
MARILGGRRISILVGGGGYSKFTARAKDSADVPSSLILSTLMMAAVRFSETSLLTIATRRNIPEGDILHSHRRENLKSYIALTGWNP